MQANSIDTLYHQASERLMSTNRSYYLLQCARFLLLTLLACAGLLLLYTLVGTLFDLPAALRVSYWFISAAVAGFAALRYLLPALRKAFNPSENDLYSLSRRIGHGDQSIADALVNFLQIYRDRGIAAPAAFKNLSLGQLYNQFAERDFGGILSIDGLKKPLLRLGMLLTLFLLLWIAFPSAIGQSLLKILQPTRSFAIVMPVSLHNVSGDQEVLKNEAVRLAGNYNGIKPGKLWLVVQTRHSSSDSVQLEKLELSGGSGSRFNYDMNYVRESFNYWFEAQVDVASFQNRVARSDTAVVTVRERPHVRELQAKLTFPAYTGLEAQLLAPNNGEVTALTGTRVSLDLAVNKTLSRATLMFGDSSKLELQVLSNRARGEFVVTRDDQYQILVEDTEGISNYQPIKYAVFALRDESPFVEITRPGEDVDLGDETSIPLLVNLRDDYGFSKLELKGRHIRAGSGNDTSSFAIRMPLQRLDRNRAVADYQWDLYDFFMVPDDYIEYYAEVSDNDRISGPKTSRSKTWILRLPSVGNLFQEAEQTLSEQLEETGEIRRESEELKKQLEEINREMLREEELSWERKQEIQEQMQQQKAAMEKLQEIREQMEEMVQKMDQNQMLSPETLQKYFELQKMFQEVASPELLEAMKQLEDAMKNADMEQMKQAMENFQLSVENFEERIERTFELFKRVQLEQKMDQLVKMAEDLLQKQRDINEQLAAEQLPDKQAEQLARQEEALRENAEGLQRELQDAQQDFQEMMSDVAQDLQEAGDYMQQQEMTQQMQQIQQSLQQGQKQQAGEQGEKLQQNLEMLQSKMQQAQQGMTQQQKQEAMQAMQKIQQDLLRTSFEQEKLAAQSDKTDMSSNTITEIARQQSRSRENLTRTVQEVLDLSKQTFFVSPQMNQIINSVMENMDNSLQALENRNPRSAARSQQKAMGDINRAVMSMQNSMQQLSQAGSGSGFEEFMQQMQQMAGQQGQLNQQTMSMFQMQQQGGQGMSGEMMARMAAQQGLIQQSLENLNQKMGNRGDVLGRLGEMGEEMEKVIAELQGRQIDPKVIERQQRILSRMLDAQKSMREKEYSRQRESENEAAPLVKSPPRLQQELLERENRLRREMLDALKEGYSAEYKDYIKAYYELLSRQSPKNPATPPAGK